MAIAGTALACFPLAVAADQSLLLEPYLVFFCLLGVVAMFSAGRLASPRRVMLAGIAFGFAGSVRIWAIIPILVAVAVCVPLWRNALRPLALGAIVGFAVPCLPFFLAAPNAFLHDVIIDQLSRAAPGAGSLPATQRLLMMTGVSGLPGLHAATGLAVGIAIGLVVFVVLVYGVLVRSNTRADWFVLGASAAITAAMFFSHELFDHYTYFPAAFLAMLVGICVARALTALGAVDVLILRHLGAPVIPMVLAVVVAVLVVPQQTSYAKSYLSGAEDPSTILAGLIPPGACVVLDESTFAIVANRFDPAKHGCPAVVDPYGVWLATFSAHLPPYSGPYPEEFVATWGQWLNRADDVVLVGPQSDVIPWSADLTSWFNGDFRLLFSQPGLFVYEHVRHTSPPGVNHAGIANQLVEAGLAAEGAGNVNQAFADYKAAATEDHHNKYAHYDLGYIYQQRGNTTRASTEYRKALLIDPKFADALYNMGVLETPTDPVSAMEFYKQDLQVEPTNASANFNLGVLLIKVGETAQGDTYLETGLRLNPTLAADVPPGLTVPSTTTTITP